MWDRIIGIYCDDYASRCPSCRHIQLSRYRLHPSLQHTRVPSSAVPTRNLSHRAPCPAPSTTRESSLTHPMIPLGGRPPGTPGIGAFSVGDLLVVGTGSSPISKCALANEYVSE